MDVATLSAGDMALLGRTFLFAGVPQSVVLRAVEDERCVARACAKGQPIYTPRDFYHSLGILLSGQVQVTKRSLLVSVLQPGELFGAAALFNQRTCYATTLTPCADCRFLLLPQALVEALLAESAALGSNYIRYLSGRIRFLEEKLEGQLAGSAERRLAQYLLTHCSEHGPPCDCAATTLSRQLNVSRAALYRAFDGLTALGAIEKSGKTIRVLQENLLRSV